MPADKDTKLERKVREALDNNTESELYDIKADVAIPITPRKSKLLKKLPLKLEA